MQTLVDMQEGNEEAGSGETKSKQETGEDSEDESRGIDLMTSDDEEDEEIEFENEEDRAFLREETEKQEEISIYRRLIVQLDTEGDRGVIKLLTDEDMLFGEAQTSYSKVLNKLAEKLHAYLNELPMLSFNSGKYDLNAVKEFLFLYLIEHHPIKFTVKRNNNHMCLKTISEAPGYFELCCTGL